MELILKKDVQNLGFKDDIVIVKNGYGRNFLIPQGHAVLATASAKKVLAENLKQRAFKEQKLIDDARKLEKAYGKLSIKIEAKVGVGDKLFGSVNHANVSEALAVAGQELDKKYISVPGGSIKRLGSYHATIRLHREVVFNLPFDVVPSAAE
jgi:large subunit ribosomal protein L9